MAWQAKQKACRTKWLVSFPNSSTCAENTLPYNFCKKTNLKNWTATYQLPDKPDSAKNVGIVMAGNIRWWAFMIFFVSLSPGIGRPSKLSSKDDVLIRHLVRKLHANGNQRCRMTDLFAERLKGCDAYIATGSNNSRRYFEYYFGKYPHIIRRNRTSVAILNGTETTAELESLADDVHLYFGLGCRNVTKIICAGRL